MNDDLNTLQGKAALEANQDALRKKEKGRDGALTWETALPLEVPKVSNMGFSAESSSPFRAKAPVRLGPSPYLPKNSLFCTVHIS